MWVYSPDRLDSVGEYAERYPGDGYVDILGADAYHFGGTEGISDFNARARRQLDGAMALSARNGKLIALSETGSEGLPVSDWYSKVLAPLLAEYPVAYVCVWRNARHDVKPGHFYAPYKGHPAEADFRSFTENPRVLMAGEIKE